MRVYLTTTEALAAEIIRDGWRDLHVLQDLTGVWLASQPLDANDGFDGNVILCLEVPETLFAKWEIEWHPSPRTPPSRRAPTAGAAPPGL